MTILVVKDFRVESLNSTKYSTRSEIRADDYEAVAVESNFHWGHSGTHFGGYVFEQPFRTSNTSYTTSNANSLSQRNLDDINISGQFRRVVNDGGTDSVAITCQAYGADFRMNFNIYNIETSTLLTTVNITKSGDSPAWDETTSYIPLSDVTDGSGNMQMIKVLMSAREDDTDADFCEIYQVNVVEADVTDNTKIPTSLS